MTRYCLQIEYDGTAYCGWQRQKNGVSVQEKVENALFFAFGVQTTVTASGRTDAGVHAACQVAHFDATLTLPPEKVREAMNAHLPGDIKILRSALAKEGFHARYSAKRKTYRYEYYLSDTERPLLSRYAARGKRPVNLAAMQAAAKTLIGKHDFAAFSSTGSSVKDTVREIYEIAVAFTPFSACAEEQNFLTEGQTAPKESSPLSAETDDCLAFNGKLTVTVTGNGFLYNMVRIIAGTLLAVGEGDRTADVFPQAFQKKDRKLLGKTAPAEGLTLLFVQYENT